MKQVKITCDAVKAITIAHDMKRLGYIQSNDFAFAYNQSRWDDMIGEIPSHTIFTFYDEQIATWFALTYL